MNTSKLSAVKSIDIVTGYGKTRMRGVRHGDDGMRKRVRGMLEFMNIKEVDQPNKGRIHIDKEALIDEVTKNGGKIIFDEKGFTKFKEQNTTANHIPNIVQQVRPRFRPTEPFTPHDDGRRSSSFRKHREGSDSSKGNDFHRNKRRGTADYRGQDNYFEKKHRQNNWGSEHFLDSNERNSYKRVHQGGEGKNEAEGSFQGDWRNSHQDNQYRGLNNERQGRRSSDLTDYRSRQQRQGSYHKERNTNPRRGSYNDVCHKPSRQGFSTINSQINSTCQNSSSLSGDVDDYHLQRKRQDNSFMNSFHRDEVQKGEYGRSNGPGDFEHNQLRRESGGPLKTSGYGEFERSPVRRNQFDSKTCSSDVYSQEEFHRHGNHTNVSDTNRGHGQDQRNFKARDYARREADMKDYVPEDYVDGSYHSRSRAQFNDERMGDVNKSSRYRESDPTEFKHSIRTEERMVAKRRGYNVDSSTASFSARGF